MKREISLQFELYFDLLHKDIQKTINQVSCQWVHLGMGIGNWIDDIEWICIIIDINLILSVGHSIFANAAKF